MQNNDQLFWDGQIYNNKTLTKAGPQASEQVTTLKEKKTDNS